ncbi:hypothetical protein ABZT48_05360 [Streptomyces avermitilis]|uniref:hypothetical protein n=1 Tax=Streptomyces avermitilis TaxID=33903 RepID=UPI0033B9DCA7
MKYVADSTGQVPSGRTDLQEFLDALTTILLVLRDHPEAVQECRIAFALLLHGTIKGIRALSIASGLHQEQVWEITSSEDGGLSPYGLVRTVERGTSWTSEGREKGSYTLADTDRVPHTNSSSSNNPPTPLGEEGLKSLKNLGTYRVRFASGIELKLLDPALDLWRRSKTELGSEGWRVAVLTGLAPVEMAMADWAELLQVTPANARKLAVKFEAHAVATRTKQGRSVRISLCWSNMLKGIEEYEAENLLSRAKKLQNRHAREQERIQRPLSFEEIEVRRRSRKSATYASYLQDALDEAESPEHRKDLERLLHAFAGATEADWRRWMDAGRSLTEAEVRELAGLPEPVKPKQPTPEELAVMVQRVTKEPEMPKVPEVLPAPQPAQEKSEGETEDDFKLRTLCQGNPRIFESLYFRLPNQEAVVDARTQARIDKARRRRERAARVAIPS